jgi:hypothetical protein
MKPVRSSQVIHPSAFNNHLCWFALMLVLAAGGCVSSEPLQTARRAVDAARKGKLTQFQSQLTGSARSTIGTEQGMDAIRQKLAHYANLAVGPALLVSSKQGDQGYGHAGDVLRTYKAILAGSQRKGDPPQAIYTLFLKCRISYEAFHHDEVSESCTTTIDANGIPWTNCSGGYPAYDSIDYSESCSVSRIEEPQESSAE